MADCREHTVPTSAGTVYVTETGPTDAPPVLFLHGWPQDWSAYERVMTLASPTVRAISLDLPGVGRSVDAHTDGSTTALAQVVREVVEHLELQNLTLVGHDLGGMVTYSYLRRYDDLAAAVIMDTVVPGVPPWDAVIANPYIWHFAFHSIPDLPETLISGNEAEYFDYFFDILSHDASSITASARQRYADAHRDPRALAAGLDWYRAFPVDSDDNQQYDQPTDTPLLYLRGEHDRGDLATYATGLIEAGVTDVRTGHIAASGHFAPDEAPSAVWDAIAAFVSP